MNTKVDLKAIIFLCTSLAYFSCSKTEENIPLDNFENLILTTDAESTILNVNETINFKLVDENGMDYTNKSQLYVNQTEVEGSSYTFNEEGNFTFYATYSGESSNTLDFEVIDNEGPVIVADVLKALPNQEISFSIIDPEGNNVSSMATYYVDGNPIDDHTFASATAGEFEVYAEYEIEGEVFSTDTKLFEVFVPKRKVVLEDYTGTWCGYCPRVAGSIENVHDLTDDVVVVAIHETANSNPDPYHFSQVEILKDEYGVEGLPAARINRSTVWNPPYDSSDALITAGQETDLSIAINSQLSGDALSINVKVIYENGSSAGDKLVVYVLESGIVHAQTNYYNNDSSSPYYQQGNPIEGFVHNEVLRESASAVLGDAIADTEAFGTFNKNYHLTLSLDYNTENMSIVAMVVNTDNMAKNAQHAKINENKEFE